MAQLYKINHKRYEFVDIDSTITTAYTISETDFNKWIKVNTSENDVDIQMPDGLSEGFRCIVENTGEFTVNYVNGVGTSLATQQDNLTEDKFRTVELVYNTTQWRIQGYVGRNNISSLYDVNTDATGVPNNGDVLQYDFNAGIWKAAPQPPFFSRSPENIDFILTEEDHGRTIPVNTTLAPVDVALNLGLPAGFRVKLINVGTGDMTITAAPTLNINTTTITGENTSVELFHSGLETYYGLILGKDQSSGQNYIKVNSTGTESSASGTDAIAIGPNVAAGGGASLAIGLNAASSGNNTVSIGAGSSASTAASIAIGKDSSTITNSGGIAIGFSSSTSGSNAISLGLSSSATASESIQLGSGTNSIADTLQYRDNTIATVDGIKAKEIPGVPGGTAQTASLAVDINNNALYFYSGSWLPAAGGATFLSAESSLSNPSIGSNTNVVAVGGGSQIDTGNNSIVIGDASVITGANGANEAIAIGQSSQIVSGTSASNGSIAIGQSSLISNSLNSIAIGHDSQCASTSSISIGSNAAVSVLATGAISLGTNSAVTGINSIAIGSSSDSNADNSLSIGSNSQALSSGSIAIGTTSTSNDDNAIAIGSSTSATAINSIAIGNNSDVSANGAIQLGTGNNSLVNSLQFQDLLIATTDGLVITDTNGLPTDTPVIGTVRFDDTTNVLYIYNGSAWVSTTLT